MIDRLIVKLLVQRESEQLDARRVELVERDAALVARREAARREREEAVARERARIVSDGVEAMREQTRRAVATIAQQLEAERATVLTQQSTIAVYTKCSRILYRRGVLLLLLILCMKLLYSTCICSTSQLYVIIIDAKLVVFLIQYLLLE